MIFLVMGSDSKSSESLLLLMLMLLRLTALLGICTPSLSEVEGDESRASLLK